MDLFRGKDIQQVRYSFISEVVILKTSGAISVTRLIFIPPGFWAEPLPGLIQMLQAVLLGPFFFFSKRKKHGAESQRPILPMIFVSPV
ncbi:MAG: hypothetical protein LJE96_12195, partial [Deltaproteobacteria bacterium]|nr:hypothetical protein [Deltaproteobacteria bacterium]